MSDFLERLGEMDPQDRREFIEAFNSLTGSQAQFLARVGKANAVLREQLTAAQRERDALAERVERLREAAAWAYQMAGARCPDERAMDNLSDLLRGESPRHEWPRIPPADWEETGNCLRSLHLSGPAQPEPSAPPKCSTCDRAYDDPDAKVCSNPVHLPPEIRKKMRDGNVTAEPSAPVEVKPPSGPSVEEMIDLLRIQCAQFGDFQYRAVQEASQDMIATVDKLRAAMQKERPSGSLPGEGWPVLSEDVRGDSVKDKWGDGWVPNPIFAEPRKPVDLEAWAQKYYGMSYDEYLKATEAWIDPYRQALRDRLGGGKVES